MFSQSQAGTLVTPSGKGEVAPSGISTLRAARLNLPLLRLFTAPVRPTQRSPASWSWRGHRRQPSMKGPSQQAPQSRLLVWVQHREMLLIRGIRSSFSTSPDHLHIILNYSSEVQTLCSPRQKQCSTSPGTGTSSTRQREDIPHPCPSLCHRLTLAIFTRRTMSTKHLL